MVDGTRERPRLEKRHRGVVVPMVTPLLADGRIDRSSAERITDHLIGGGCHVFVLGTTGEAASIPVDQGAELVDAVVRRTSGRAMVYAGVSTNALRTAVDNGRRFLDLGADAIVVHPPCYFPATPRELLHYYERLADRLEGPLLIYNIPLTTHLSIPLEVVEALSPHPNIVGLKDSEANRDRLEQSLERWSARADFAHLIGTEQDSVHGLELGSDGIVPGGANLAPGLYRRLYDAAIAGDHEAAALDEQIALRVTGVFFRGRPLGEALAALKVLMAEHGLCEPHMLPPLSRLDAKREEELLGQWRAFEREGGADGRAASPQG